MNVYSSTTCQAGWHARPFSTHELLGRIPLSAIRVPLPTRQNDALHTRLGDNDS